MHLFYHHHHHRLLLLLLLLFVLLLFLVVEFEVEVDLGLPALLSGRLLEAVPPTFSKLKPGFINDLDKSGTKASLVSN